MYLNKTEAPMQTMGSGKRKPEPRNTVNIQEYPCKQWEAVNVGRNREVLDTHQKQVEQ